MQYTFSKTRIVKESHKNTIIITAGALLLLFVLLSSSCLLHSWQHNQYHLINWSIQSCLLKLLNLIMKLKLHNFVYPRTANIFMHYFLFFGSFHFSKHNNNSFVKTSLAVSAISSSNLWIIFCRLKKRYLVDYVTTLSLFTENIFL